MANVENLVEESGSGGGAINDAAGPLRRQAGVMIGVEVREEVRDGEIGVGVFEPVDDEASAGNEFGIGDGGGRRGEGATRWWRGRQREGGEGGAVECGGG